MEILALVAFIMMVSGVIGKINDSMLG